MLGVFVFLGISHEFIINSLRLLFSSCRFGLQSEEITLDNLEQPHDALATTLLSLFFLASAMNSS